MRHKLSELHENHCQNLLQNRPTMCPKLDQKWLPNWFSNKHFKMSDFGTILDLVLAPQNNQKSIMFSAMFLDTSKSCIETIMSSTTSPKWNQLWSIFGTWRPCDFAAIYHTFERSRISETVTFPIEFRCLVGDTFWGASDSFLTTFEGRFSTCFPNSPNMSQHMGFLPGDLEIQFGQVCAGAHRNLPSKQYI